MFTIDLEKVLKQQRTKVITPKELLAIEQYDKLSDESVMVILKRSGFYGTVEDGHKLKQKLQKIAETNAQFPPDRIYHIDQIKKLCYKYRLKFLPTKLYRGQVPNNIAETLVQHERTFKFKLAAETSFIMAPASSFELKARPKDPLLFHKINDEHYFLLHKWGNDLSAWRCLLPFMQPSVCTFIFGIIFAVLSRNLPVKPEIGINERTIGVFIGSSILAFVLFIIADTRFVYNTDTKQY